MSVIDPLDQVLTIREVARRWNKHPTTVRRALDDPFRPLVFRKSPNDRMGIILISYSSVVRRFGQPRE